MNQKIFRTLLGCALLCVLAFLGVLRLSSAMACPFCAALSNTLSQDIESTKVVVLGTYLDQMPAEPGDFAVTLKFKVSFVIKGAEQIAIGKNVNILATEPMKAGEAALLMGQVDQGHWQWWAIGPLSEEAQLHVKKLSQLGASGKDRLAYFLPFLTSTDKVLKDDAFNEFALASMEDLNSLKPVLKRDQVTAVLTNPATSKELRRLHWTLLSICGEPADAAVPERMILQHIQESEDSIGLDAAISCFIALRGEQALATIEQHFLANPNARYADVNAAVLAIRVHGTELEAIPRSRLLKSLHMVLEKPDLADLVISDLARWQDWSQVDRLVKLYAAPVDKSQFLRIPVIRYLEACPSPDAALALQKCKELDPDSFRRAQLLFSLPEPPDQN